ncbi:MAG: endo-1,4-beta-xylanase [Clostridia bacterium]|nr:endo-1,4-beta-xylanase [Clostridia bacterium]
MEDRRKVLELFEEQKEFLDEKINFGIEQYRKGYADIVIRDKNGDIVQGVKVKLTQKSHEFKFGANLFMLDELETQEKNEAYKKYFADTFNMATLPFYWDATEPEKGRTRYDKDSEKLYRRPAIDLCIEFCKKHGIEPREHALAYEHFFPEWLYNASVPEEKIAIEKRYQEISERYKDTIPTIEVTNEMEWEKGRTAFYDEPDFVEWCFKLAEKYFPANQLVINEHTAAAWGDRCRATDKYYSYIEAAMLKGARIDAIGMQYHMFFRAEEEYPKTRMYYNPEMLYKHMDLYSNFGKPLQVTEVTVPAYSNDEQDEAIQAEIIEKLYSVWFSHPNVEQIIYWNLVDGYAAFADQGDMTSGENYYYGGLLRFDMTPKPAYYTIKNLIEKKWHTETEAVSDGSGKINFKGFYGEYDVQLEVDGKTVHTNIKLSSKGSNVFNIDL